MVTHNQQFKSAVQKQTHLIKAVVWKLLGWAKIEVQGILLQHTTPT